MDMHARFAATLETCYAETRAIQQEARRDGRPARRPRWRATVLRTPKGWTGPHVGDGHPRGGTLRADQGRLPHGRGHAEAPRPLAARNRAHPAGALLDNAGPVR